MNDDAEVRELARLIWECEGRPLGRESKHWELAWKLAEAAALAPNKSHLHGTSAIATRLGRLSAHQRHS